VHDGVDVLDAEERIKDAMRVVEPHETRLREHAAHLGFEVAPLLYAIEVFEHREAPL
jgi:hypothetical protein